MNLQLNQSKFVKIRKFAKIEGFEDEMSTVGAHYRALSSGISTKVLTRVGDANYATDLEHKRAWEKPEVELYRSLKAYFLC